MKLRYFLGVTLYALAPVLTVLYFRMVGADDKLIGHQARVSPEEARINYEDHMLTNASLNDLWESLGSRGALTPDAEEAWLAIMEARKADEDQLSALAREDAVVDRSVGSNQQLQDSFVTQEQAIRLLIAENAELSRDLTEAGSTIARLRRSLEQEERLERPNPSPHSPPPPENLELDINPMGGPESCQISALSSFSQELPREYTFFFDVESSAPRPDIVSQLDKVVSCLSVLNEESKIDSITVVGFSDPTGPRDLNEEVATSRADTAANVFVAAVRDGKLSADVTVRRESNPSWAVDGSEENPSLRKVVVLIEYL